MSSTALYLHLDGITGTFPTPPFAGHIAISSYSLGVSDFVQRSPNVGPLPGKLNFNDLSFVKQIDITSISLFEHCCRGTSIPNATLSLAAVPPSGPNQLLYKLDLTGVIITSFSQGAVSGTAEADETFSLSFNTIKATWNIPSTAANPNPSSPSAGWNVVTNSTL